MLKYYVIQKSFCIKIHFFMFLANFIFVFSHLKIHHSKMFPCATLFLYFWRNVCQSTLVPQKKPCPKNFGLRTPAPGHYYFCKMFYLECLAVFWIGLCLDNCSVICTVTLCYVLHQTHLEFWHIQHSFVYSGICRHIQSFVRHIHTYWDILKTYSGLFRDIQDTV